MLTWEEAVNWLRHQPDQQDLVKACYYDDPLEQAAVRYAESEEWNAVIRLLDRKAPSSVLDIGAGRGISSYAFARSGYSVTALEPDTSVLVGSGAIRDLFAKTGMQATIMGERGERLPFPDAAFDIVYGRAVLHHAADLKQFCAEAYRVLKPGGIFLMTREHVISRKENLQSFLDAHPLHKLYGGEHAYLLTEYIDAIRTSGLRILNTIGPYESAINYAPTTADDIHQMTINAFATVAGTRLARVLANIDFLKDWYCRRLSRNSDVPGRLYTFKAVK